MGQYRIIIDGVGCHHNGERAEQVGDANHLAAKLVAELKQKGHSITRAEFQQPAVARVDDLLSGQEKPSTPHFGG